MVAAFWGALLLGTIPAAEAPIRDHFTTIELNSYYDEKGDLVFHQFLLKDWNPYLCRYEVAAWRLVKNPINMPAQGKFIFFDQSDNCLRHVTYDHAEQTHTQYDPELIDRAILPKEIRRELSKPIRHKEKE